MNGEVCECFDLFFFVVFAYKKVHQKTKKVTKNFLFSFSVKKSKKEVSFFPSLSSFFCSLCLFVPNKLSSVFVMMSFSRFYDARRVLSFSRSDAMLFSSLLEREKLFSPQKTRERSVLSLSLSKGERL